jgi:hypothetical protein
MWQRLMWSQRISNSAPTMAEDRPRFWPLITLLLPAFPSWLKGHLESVHLLSKSSRYKIAFVRPMQVC